MAPTAYPPGAPLDMGINYLFLRSDSGERPSLVDESLTRTHPLLSKNLISSWIGKQRSMNGALGQISLTEKRSSASAAQRGAVRGVLWRSLRRRRRTDRYRRDPPQEKGTHAVHGMAPPRTARRSGGSARRSPPPTQISRATVLLCYFRRPAAGSRKGAGRWHQ